MNQQKYFREKKMFNCKPDWKEYLNKFILPVPDFWRAGCISRQKCLCNYMVFTHLMLY